MWHFEKMKQLVIVISIFVLTSLSCIGQKINIEIIDSIFIHSDSPSEFRLKFLENCDNAYIIAEQDILSNEAKILIVGGIAPTIYSTDNDFETKYQITYSDYGDLSANDECMYNYNSKVFDYLTEKYGKKWSKEVRSDVYGLKQWNKQKNRKHQNSPIWKYDCMSDTILKLRRISNKELNIISLIDIINSNYSGKVNIDFVKVSNDTIFIEIIDSECLTQKMGTTGADEFMIITTFTLTELNNINLVNYKFEFGDHATPGTYTRDYFLNWITKNRTNRN